MQQQPNVLMQLAPLILIFVIFYLVMILPMRRRQKKHQEMLSKLTRGDRVVTTGGIFGTVVDVQGDVLLLRVADNVKLQVARSAVAGLAGDAANVNFGASE
jgi:preprotein translocase subunit YajC